MVARIKSITLQNFKGCKDKTYSFDGKNAAVSGANATGKTTIVDAFWWCLFNKDSLGNEKFSIRPLDVDGKQIDNVEIKVSVVLDIDGMEKEFTKTQKQKWVKKRGSDVTELQGNVNLYEIDGYPKAEKDYKTAISEIVSEDVFKMITNPTYFPSLKWKEQREILMRFVSEASDYELASGNPAFAGLLDELQKAPSTDDIKAKYQKALTEWKKKQVEIPVRIDEAEKSKVDIDVAELELQKNGLKEQIAEVKAKREDISKQAEEYQKLSDGILELKFSMNDLQRKANEELFRKRREIENKISDKKFLAKQTESTIADTERDIKREKDNIVAGEDSLTKARKKWKTENERVFDENSLICTYCGQEYPTEKKEQLRTEFETHKSKRLKDITFEGNVAKQCLDETKEKLANLEAELPQRKESLEMLNTAIADLEKQLSELPESVDIDGTDEVLDITLQIAEKQMALDKMKDTENYGRELSLNLSDLQFQLMDCEKEIALAQKNVEIDERISELQAEQKDVAQKVADQEKMLYLLEQFIRYKMDSVSDSINGKFEMANFILFKNLINGGLQETCECEYKGVPYSSLNSAAKIQCGLDIVRSLQRLYNSYLPVFIDNRESCTDIPTMDCQVINFYVSPNDKEIRVELD